MEHSKNLKKPPLKTKNCIKSLIHSGKDVNQTIFKKISSILFFNSKIDRAARMRLIDR